MIARRYFIPIGVYLLVLAMAMACNRSPQKTTPLFKSMSPDRTSIDFVNTIHYDKKFNIIRFPYIYNGGGVAAGDINNDGLTDLYFTGNRVSSRLYLNKGAFQFKDITVSSGTSTQRWAGGVSMVDINHDGYLDIYVSVTGTEDSAPSTRKNLLFINNRDTTFTETAEAYGLADTGFTTHAAFFDYDRDGDLDAYLMNNYVGSFSRESHSGLSREINSGGSRSIDALYRNNGNGSFTEVSQQAGITKGGYSLGIAIADINRDGWPDVYISNDIQTDDLLYINNGDGTFTDQAARYFKHTSYAGMGTDIADFNNDGWPDILQVDMLPPRLSDKQQVAGAVSYEYIQTMQQQGYQTQHNMNTLQLSNGRDQKGRIRFSEIAQMAGVHATDWSWSGLFGDYDNDGWKDIMITNGYPKAVNSYDYLIDVNRSTMFGDEGSKKQRAYEIMDQLKGYKPHNYFFKNKGDLTFADRSFAWGFREPSFSYGAAQADLDNDGDLDIAINNINGPANILQNQSDSLKNNHYLAISLRGDSLNPAGIGSHITISTNGAQQYAYVSPYRGYQSTVSADIHFGLGKYKQVDTLKVFWPDGKYQVLKKIKADQTLELNYLDARQPIAEKEDSVSAEPAYMKAVPGKLNIAYKHQENAYVDFTKEPLLPRMLSRMGPAVAVGDVNNDGREDLYLGGASGQGGMLYLQQKEGNFAPSSVTQPWVADAAFEDTDATFFDANGDGGLDLYVVSGGNSFSPASAQLQDRLYLNTGHGKYVKADNMLPRMFTSSSVVTAADYDKDGDQDLFVGGSHIPGQYPEAPRSYILRNDHTAFTDVTAEVAPGLVAPGHISDAIWADFNGDEQLDLVTAGLGEPISFFENHNGQFQNRTANTDLEGDIGWWQSIEASDVDDDGDTDFIAGNLGLNTSFNASSAQPIILLTHDFNDDQQVETLWTVEKEGAYYPLHSMRNMMKQFPDLSRKVRSFRAYAEASVTELFGSSSVDNAGKKTITTFATSVIINQGEGTFAVHSLPNAAQISPANDILTTDVNEDGRLDLIMAGNIYHPNPEIPRMDAGNGLVLLGDGAGNFAPVSPFKSGFLAPKNIRKLALLHTATQRYLLVINNDAPPKVMIIQ